MTTRTWTATHARVVGARQGWRCAKCNEVLESTYELDHVHEHADGGSEDLSNAQILCQRCHAAKTQEWRMRRVEAIRAAKEEEARPKNAYALPTPGSNDAAFLNSKLLKFAYLPPPMRRPFAAAS